MRAKTIADIRRFSVGRLFEQVKKEVYAHVRAGDQRRFDRYSSGSLSDPLKRPTNHGEIMSND